jgi:phosphoribosylaminoimidazolecarboxamide formyltransferase/IMP cyclohydrolase
MADLKNMYKTVAGDPFPDEMTLTLGQATLKFRKRTWKVGGEVKGLRYGENPDQPAALYELAEGGLELGGVAFRGPGAGLVSSIGEEDMLQAGKHPGKINLTDVDNGLNILSYLAARPAAVILKHNNPCGASWTDDGLARAFRRAHQADRIAAFGGTIVVNRTMDTDTARQIADSYFEVVAAPEFEGRALDILKGRKNLRILRIRGIDRLQELCASPYLDVKSLMDGGLVTQFSFRNRVLGADDFLPAQAHKDGATLLARAPDKNEAEDLLFAWAVEAGVTSNSVIFALGGTTVSIGTGEQDRVGCVDLAIAKANTKYADRLAFAETGKSLYELRAQAEDDPRSRELLDDIHGRTRAARGGLPGSVLVSDGFFPFPDGVDLAISQGVTAIAQPGGSIRDHEIIAAVNRATPQVAMVFTGQRSFRH